MKEITKEFTIRKGEGKVRGEESVRRCRMRRYTKEDKERER